ncbi:aminoglycoside phosphotransferase family protein [Photobacterium lutimaris]|uniref:Phosphotransferase n=1 Tax=Photobacterium lutimaris TaxID=388278 RepID=A0A2T3IL03_9GAMM|nr:aminoglycoside phosphotransferase family protein [Photobacterium lutimaris]PSU29041.1 phosphotransferase [Photobacterium lutimaris]TDR75648.1 phosphotransferase family enzyme [Photobacterium lutimaris]
MEELQGGRDGLVCRSEDKVYRPSGFWSFSVHQLLSHLESEGFNSAPKSYGFDNNGNEVLSYVLGDVYNYPLVGAIATPEALCSAAALLRQYHDATVSFVKSKACDDLRWLLPTREPQEVICHGDYAPYNVALNGNTVVGVFDFDTAHPATRIWDVAYAVYCWAPFKTHPCDSLGDLTEQTIRAKQFCDSYGLSHEGRTQLVDTIISRLRALVDFMHSEAAKGNEAFIGNIKDGHHLAYIADIEFLKRNKKQITDSL